MKVKNYKEMLRYLWSIHGVLCKTIENNPPEDIMNWFHEMEKLIENQINKTRR